jgi:hypothetical protein
VAASFLSNRLVSPRACSICVLVHLQSDLELRIPPVHADREFGETETLECGQWRETIVDNTTQAVVVADREQLVALLELGEGAHPVVGRVQEPSVDGAGLGAADGSEVGSESRRT